MSLVLAILFHLLIVATPTPTPMPTPLPHVSQEEMDAITRQQMFDLQLLIDDARRMYAAPDADPSLSLNAANYTFAIDSATTQRCSSLDGQERGPLARAEDEGYPEPMYLYQINYCQHVDPQQVINDLLRDPLRRAKLLDPNVKDYGVGIWVDALTYKGFVAISLGAPWPPGSHSVQYAYLPAIQFSFASLPTSGLGSVNDYHVPLILHSEEK